MKKQLSVLRKSGFMPAVLAVLAVVIAMALPGCQQEDPTLDDLALKSAVIPQLTITYPDEACPGEDFTILFSSTCGKVKIERGYINGDPILNDLNEIVGYEKIHAGLTCDTPSLQWEPVGTDAFLPCTGGTITQNWSEVGTYVYRAKLNQKAVKNSGCPDCAEFKGNKFECFMVTVTECGSGTFTDSRDQEVYKWVKNGDQVWMAENLAYKTATGSWAYNNDESNVAVYGRLYDWATAMNGYSTSDTNPSGVQGICPTGWHLPSDAEWDQLAGFVSEQKGPYTKNANYEWENVGKHLKSTGTIEDNDGLWHFYDVTVEGTDDFGFSALPGGSRSSTGTFLNFGEKGYWWSSTETETYPTRAVVRSLSFHSTFFHWGMGNKVAGWSVRCVRD